MRRRSFDSEELGLPLTDNRNKDKRRDECYNDVFIPAGDFVVVIVISPHRHHYPDTPDEQLLIKLEP